jgi:hypothetical protein
MEGKRQGFSSSDIDELVIFSGVLKCSKPPFLLSSGLTLFALSFSPSIGIPSVQNARPVGMSMLSAGAANEGFLTS